MKTRWTQGNALTLLENGEAFYPAVFEAISQARREVLLETFIWFDDKVGRELRAVLIAAARRGVQVDVTIDGYGSPDLSDEFVAGLAEAGVRLRVFDPCVRVMGVRLQVLRRMHRKIVVIDGERAFVGGINYSADHLADFGPEAKQDYAVEVRGPVVEDIHRFAHQALQQPARWRPRWWPRRRAPAAQGELADAGSAEALFVVRDNDEHPQDIERHYRAALRTAQREVIIANAYFFPGYRLLRELRRAAKRGVRVSLILQGEPDMAIVKLAARLLYPPLLKAGVEIYEYCERPLHGKVALVDERWATVGSSNLDPLSLALNLEANLVIRDTAFNATLRGRLDELRQRRCQRIASDPVGARTWWRPLVSGLVYHLVRHFPGWARWLPAHKPLLVPTKELS